jgi:Mn2+/Fe2+ NRAMP family transporter
VRSFPHSGQVARGLFAVGIVSFGMLAVPVMAGATSYALSEARGKREGLELKPRDGRYFYGVITVAMLAGLCLNFTGVSPIRALVFAAMFNGIAAIQLLVFIDRIAASRDVMGEARSGWLSRAVLAVTILGMTGSVAAMAVSCIKA